MKLEIVPITLRDANAYVAQHHRHHKPVAGHEAGRGGALTESIIKPKRPVGPGWRQIRGVPLPIDGEGYPYEVWAHDAHGLGVISAVEVAAEKVGMQPLGPAFHISVSAFGSRCSSADALWVLGQFDLVDAREDNHVPNGKVRNFWRYVADHLSGYECGCVGAEPAMREDKGDFVWRGIS